MEEQFAGLPDKSHARIGLRKVQVECGQPPKPTQNEPISVPEVTEHRNVLHQRIQGSG